MRVRKSVYSLNSNDQTIEWYRRAVEVMVNRPISDPTSWSYVGAVHGNPFAAIPTNARRFWNQCAHGSWFFLPWHRMYLASFEAIVAKVIEDEGGPRDWALPYWNYSQDLNEEPQARLLPPAFREPVLPDGSSNLLFSRRFIAPDGDFSLDDTIVTLDAMKLSSFTNHSDPTDSFGGLPHSQNIFSNSSGQLEIRPHNVIHVAIGGYMADPATAAFDPIFWLHHCNIDRLWEVWRKSNSQHNNPLEAAWKTGSTFPMHEENGQAFSFTSQDTEDTTQVLHGYLYDDPATRLEEPVPEQTESRIISMVDPELVGRSQEPLQLEGTVTKIEVMLSDTPTELSFTESTLPTPEKVLLVLENIRGTGVPGDYRIFVAPASEDRNPIEIGILSTFGVTRASDPAFGHGGTGLTQVYDLTFAAELLGITSEKPGALSFSFELIEKTAILTEAPPAVSGLLNEYGEANEMPSVEVEHISLYFR